MPLPSPDPSALSAPTQQGPPMPPHPSPCPLTLSGARKPQAALATAKHGQVVSGLGRQAEGPRWCQAPFHKRRTWGLRGSGPAWASQPGVSSGAQPGVGLGLRAFSWGNEGNGSRGLPSGLCGTGRPHSITHTPVTGGKVEAPRGHVPGTEALGAGPWQVLPDAMTLGGVPGQRACKQPRRRLSFPP